MCRLYCIVLTDSDAGESGDDSSSDEDEPSDVKTPTAIMEVDDETDEDSMAVLMEDPIADGYWLCNTQRLAGLPLQTEVYFGQV